LCSHKEDVLILVDISHELTSSSLSLPQI